MNKNFELQYTVYNGGYVTGFRIGGNGTYPLKAAIKSQGFKWDSLGKVWVRNSNLYTPNEFKEFLLTLKQLYGVRVIPHKSSHKKFHGLTVNSKP